MEHREGPPSPLRKERRRDQPPPPRRRPDGVKPGDWRGGMYSMEFMTRSGPSKREVTITESAAFRTDRTIARS